MWLPENKHRAFTLIEILAALGIMAILLAVAVGFLRPAAFQIKSAAYDLVKDIQGTSAQSLRDGKVMRIHFLENLSQYTIDEFEPPKPMPSPSEKEAFEAWEKRQRDFERLGSRERSEQSRLARGTFKVIRERELPSAIKIKQIYGPKGRWDLNQDKTTSLFFYPSGETDSALIVIESSSGRAFSLVTTGATGKVTMHPRELSEEEWKTPPKAE